MRAELRDVSPNDYPGWEAFASSERPEPWDDFGWFELSIGPEGDKGCDLFQVLVTTPAAVSRAKLDCKRHHKEFRCLLVETFEPDVIAKALRDHVSGLTALTWDGLVKQLRRSMYWEYEGRGN